MKNIKSIAELIEMKKDITEKRNEIKEIYIPSLDTVFKYKTIKRTDFIQVQDLDKIDIDPYIIYSHVIEPDLSNQQLQEAYNQGKEPYKIVDELLTIKEIGMLSLAIIDQSNLGNLAKDIKNS